MTETHHEQPTRVERRLAATVAADVAGYSRLRSSTRSARPGRFARHRKVTDALVAKHGVRLVKSTADGVLLEFPSVADHGARTSERWATIYLLICFRFVSTSRLRRNSWCLA